MQTHQNNYCMLYMAPFRLTPFALLRSSLPPPPPAPLLARRSPRGHSSDGRGG